MRMTTWITILLLILQLDAFGMDVKRHFADVRKEAIQRWDAFCAGREFVPYSPGRTDSELAQEFEELDKIRRDIWLLPEYAVAQPLITNDHVRYTNGAAFGYNNSASYYNASTMFIENRPYVALQGPRTKEVKRFFTLLKSLRVTHLVRLTDAYEGAKGKMQPLLGRYFG